jgi:hypothetical protein
MEFENILIEGKNATYAQKQCGQAFIMVDYIINLSKT